MIVQKNTGSQCIHRNPDACYVSALLSQEVHIESPRDNHLDLENAMSCFNRNWVIHFDKPGIKRYFAVLVTHLARYTQQHIVKALETNQAHYPNPGQ